ncbi:hypothetical protein BC941DRAFT_455247 [Chlamydoabsidia padenii]|nr:hypothetical protein BC941DRAFT_455247 [Chlamydoabsidia padenii]
MDSADYLAYKPFSRRLIAIRAEEIEEFTMYSEKYLTIEKEARAILQNIDDKSVMEKMIDRAILFTYLHFRTIMSLTVLFHRCSGDLALPPATFIKLVGTALHQLVNNRYAINTNAYKKRKSTAMHDERLRKKRQVGGLPEENDQKKEDGHEDDNEQKSTDNNIQENNNQTGDNENNEINKNSVIPEEKEPDDKKETGEKKKTFYK